MASTTARSCAQCRAAKLRCDLVRPICGRCRRRGTPCEGYHAEGSFTFRDETERAQRLSRRARGEPLEGSSSTGAAIEHQSSDTATPQDLEVNTTALQARFSWLNERALAMIPARVKADPEAHAIDRFFANWLVYPNEISPGYMHHLPRLYEMAMPDSILRLSIRALAFADIRRTSSGGLEYKMKALQSYGAAITRLRKVAQEPADFQGDETLAALLLIDAFETMYMGRNEPLGLHDQALKYMLEVRGDEQLHSPQRFCLARVAIYRLQARQLLFGEDGGALQQALLESLNLDRPDLRIMYDVAKIQRLCAIADHLIRHWEQQSRLESFAQAQDLLQEIDNLITSIEAWSSTIDEPMKPSTEVPDLDDRPRRVDELSEAHPLKCFKCPGLLRHHDTSVAFLWSFYAAAQIILRNSAVQLYRLAASDWLDLAQQYYERIEWEKLAVAGLSSTIIRSFPMFMGFDVGRWDDHRSGDRPSQASSLGRFLGVFSMVVVNRTEATSQEHKDCAGSVLAWLHRSSLNEPTDVG